MTTPSQRVINGSLVILAVVLLFFLFFFPFLIEEKPKELEKKLPASVLEKTEIQYVYVTPDITDSVDATITVNKDTVSYWYVYFTVHIKSGDNSYNGYKVIKIAKPYYDIPLAINAIVPNSKDEDYIGVEFFKRVPYETYKSYKDSDGE